MERGCTVPLTQIGTVPSPGLGIWWIAEKRIRSSAIHQMPKPGDGTVPIWVSGTVQPRSMQRLARFGDGWIPWGDDAARLPDSIARMRAAVRDAGRDPSAVGVVGTLPTVLDADGAIDLGATMAVVPSLVEVGVTDFRSNARFGSNGERLTDEIGRLVEAFRVASA